MLNAVVRVSLDLEFVKNCHPFLDCDGPTGISSFSYQKMMLKLLVSEAQLSQVQM